jgi:hypothetical protein
MLAHTIEAMVGDTIKRVHCNTCNGQHMYKGHAPGEGPTKERAAREQQSRKNKPGVTMTKASDYETFMKGRDVHSAKSYSPKEKFVVGDVVTHPTFGVGVATTLKDSTKVEILFEEGPRVLIHGR